MKTIKNNIMRDLFFNMVLDNYNQGYKDIANYQINLFSKHDINFFMFWLHAINSNLIVSIDSNKKRILINK
jgi:hypothetical protein